MPVVFTSTDDEDEEINNDIAMRNTITPAKVRVSLFGESTPRTSTPQTPHHLNLSAPTYDHSSNEEDAANISKETDDLNNSGNLNRSGGCELIGVIADSDHANNSKESTNSDEDRLPYTVEFINETNMSPASSPLINDLGGRNQLKGVELLDLTKEEYHEDKIKELEQTVCSLLNSVDKLQLQVESLSIRVEELEGELVTSRLISQVSLSRIETASNSAASGNQIATSAGGDRPLSRDYFGSTSTINKLSTYGTPTHTNGSHSQQTGLINPSSTYSRSQVAKISKNYQDDSPRQINSTQINRSELSQSCNISLMKGPLRKENIHASTNSLHTERLRSCSTSISPTGYSTSTAVPTSYQTQSRPVGRASPSSLMHSRRDLGLTTPYVSMMSLSSIGNSTVKKGSIAGSVSNLSQIGGPLSSWPSMGNFLLSKHRAKDISYDEEERIIRLLLYNNLITMSIPSWAETHYNLDRVVEQPRVRLKLDWVYGYRGRDCRSNLYYLPTGECVYFVGSVVVLYNVEEKKQRHYLGHTDSVKCLAVHPNRLIVATGQSAAQTRKDKKPIVRVWHTISLATLRVITFNEDFDRPICCLAFSKHNQGSMLAVVDESTEHTITLLDWSREKNWRLSEVNSGHEPVLAIDFHPIDKYSLVAVGKSGVNFWDVRGMTMVKKAGSFDKYDKPKYVLCFTFNDHGDTITGDSNGNLVIWQRGSTKPKKIIRDVHHNGVFSVLAMRDGTYLTGGRDRRIIEWDEEFNRTGREAELPEHCGGVRYITHAKGRQVLIGTLRNCILLGSLDKNFVLITQGHSEATSCLAIHPFNLQYLTGGFDEQIHLFDSPSHSTIWSKCLMMPATAACFSPNGSLLIIGSTLGKWLALDAITQEILFTKCDGSGTISCIKFSPDGEHFAMGSGDAQIHLYQTTDAGNKFCKVGSCVGHTTPVKEIDWSDDSCYLQTQSMNFELLYWRAANCRLVDDLDVIAEFNWSTHNCTIGFSVIGLWSDSIDSALINHCDRSNNEDLLVSVTDTGFINIFKWPACYNQCLSQKYYGNADKLNYIKFLADDTKVVAIGAKNCITTEWVVDKGENLDAS